MLTLEIEIGEGNTALPPSIDTQVKAIEQPQPKQNRAKFHKVPIGYGDIVKLENRAAS